MEEQINKLIAYIPKKEELWFREQLLSDEKTMSYNKKWGGVISFPKSQWDLWFDNWIINGDKNKRFYRYLKSKDDIFVGEIAYHCDAHYEHYIANIIIHSKFRGLGYGKAGIQILLRLAKENGLTEIYDDIAVDNPSVILFKEAGFTIEYINDEIMMLKKML